MFTLSCICRAVLAQRLSSKVFLVKLASWPQFPSLFAFSDTFTENLVSGSIFSLHHHPLPAVRDMSVSRPEFAPSSASCCELLSCSVPWTRGQVASVQTFQVLQETRVRPRTFKTLSLSPLQCDS
ncbi:unnamed protein product [Rangifer tarandus platyrhynchus]|uniref:Secreted protein n=1 Tax=Rangifer tarandus platyrhynchus TaxID=3082113 RepID=A0ABN8YNN2_RANTA|nr:unnamed protein product [Rangifer tarandus platyrhynchus]